MGERTEEEARKGPEASPLAPFWRNLRELPGNVRNAVFRHDLPVSARERSKAVFSNFFLHIHATRVHRHVMRPSATVGLGVIALSLLVVLTASGVLLMIYYKASVHDAYASILDIQHVVPTGRIIRNVHRWAAHGMVAAVFLHMARAFYTGAYSKPRELNWIIGLILLAITLALSFTGYLLPWDQLAYWAITVGANIAGSPREITEPLGMTEVFDIGGFQKELLLGAHTVGQEALTRFYVLHVAILPIAIYVFLGIHFWRIRKDGGLARPVPVDPEPPTPVPSKTYGLMAIVRDKSPAVDRDMKNTIPSWPHLFYAELAVATLALAAIVALALVADAPLKEMANPEIPENPAKAPWYFLGLQEVVSYSAFMGGIGIPIIVMLGLGLIPFLDREEKGVGLWFGGRQGKKVALYSLLYAGILVPAVLAFTVRYGWFRSWYPDIPQLVITFLNPGTLFVVAFAAWSIGVQVVTRSTRMSAVALFTTFLVGFVILTYFATVHRGPNWDFYWSHDEWPAVHGHHGGGQ